MKTSIFVAFFVISTIFINQAFALTTNDTFFDQQVYLDVIRADVAWEYTTGSKQTVVAVIDTGVDIYHQDLYQNIWLNTGEIAGDNIDNDNNGFIDDVHGWDFVHDEASPIPKISDEYSRIGLIHGTFVAGIIGAQGNNDMGIAGLNWQVSIMPLIALDGAGSGGLDKVIEAIYYAIDNGADVINLSLVGSITDEYLEEALKQAYESGVVVVAAVGNENVETFNEDAGVDLTINPRYPVCHDGTGNYVIGVGSIDHLYRKSLFSNFGDDCIDINVPGEEYIGLSYYQPVFSNYRNKYESYWSGTSLATAVVSGAAALVKSYYPSISNEDLYSLIIDSGDSIDEYNPEYQNKLGGGVLNLKNIFANISDYISYQDSLFTINHNGDTLVVNVYDWPGKLTNEVTIEGENMESFEIVSINNQPLISIYGSNGAIHQVKNYDLSAKVVSEFTFESTSSDVKIFKYKNRLLIVHNFSSNSLIEMYSLDGQLLSSFSSLFVKDIVEGDLDNDNYQEINILSGNKILSYNQLGILENTLIVDQVMSQVAMDAMNIYLSAGSKNLPIVQILNKQGQIEDSFYAYDVHFLGGVDIAITDQYIITSPGQGGGPHIRYFDFEGNLINQFFAYDAANTTGVTVESFR